MTGAAAPQAPTVQRDIEVDMTPHEVWPLVADGAGWRQWLVDEADVEIEPGAEGTVIDDGEHRHVRVDEVVPAERVTWSWWPAGRPERASTVRLVVRPSDGGSIVRITETRAVAARRWGPRAQRLASARLLLAA